MFDLPDTYPLDRGAPPVDVVPAPLPTSVYSDTDQLKREFDRLWSEDWIFVAVRSELPVAKGIAPYLTSALMIQHIDRGCGLRVLDAGCGTGLVGAQSRARLPEAQIIGADLSHEMCALAERRGVYDRVVAGFDLNEEVPDDWQGTFDAVVCCGTFTSGHVGPLRIEALLKACRPSGTLTLSVRRSHSVEKCFSEAVSRLEEKGLTTVVSHTFNGPYLDEEGADYWCLLKR